MYLCLVYRQRLHPNDHFPSRIQHRPDQTLGTCLRRYLVHLNLRELRPPSHSPLLGRGNWNSSCLVVQKLLSLRQQQQVPSCHKSLLGIYCHFSTKSLTVRVIEFGPKTRDNSIPFLGTENFMLFYYRLKVYKTRMEKCFSLTASTNGESTRLCHKRINFCLFWFKFWCA